MWMFRSIMHLTFGMKKNDAAMSSSSNSKVFLLLSILEAVSCIWSEKL